MNFAVLGLGKLGRVVASKLQYCNVKGWDVVKTDCDFQTDTLYEAIHDANVILIAVPSQHFQQLIRDIIGAYSDNRQWHTATKVTVISFTKGFSDGRLPWEIIRRELPFNPAGVVSGPMLSEEIYTKPTRAVLASDNIDFHDAIGIKCRITDIALTLSNDPIGTSLGGILKNIYALGLGLADGYELGDNAKACIATMALREMEQLMGYAIMSYAGVGDFLATCYSDKSRNYTFGKQRATDSVTGTDLCEGVKNINFILDNCKIELPVAQSIKMSLDDDDPAPIQALLRRQDVAY